MARAALERAHAELKRQRARLATLVSAAEGAKLSVESRRALEKQKQQETLARKARAKAEKERRLALGEKAPPSPMDTLAQALKGMKPKQAAPILSRLPVALAADVLMRISARASGKILGAMSPTVGAKIAKEIAGRQVEEDEP